MWLVATISGSVDGTFYHCSAALKGEFLSCKQEWEKVFLLKCLIKMILTALTKGWENMKEGVSTFSQEVEEVTFYLSHVLTNWKWRGTKSQVGDQVGLMCCLALLSPVPVSVIPESEDSTTAEISVPRMRHMCWGPEPDTQKRGTLTHWTEETSRSLWPPLPQPHPLSQSSVSLKTQDEVVLSSSLICL